MSISRTISRGTMIPKSGETFKIIGGTMNREQSLIVRSLVKKSGGTVDGKHVISSKKAR